MAPPTRRLLELLDSEDTESIVVCGNAPLRQKTVQNAGQAFWDCFENVGGSRRTPSSPDDKAKDSDSDDKERKSPDSKKKKKDKKDQEALKLPECLKGEDLYLLLELDTGASQDDIKKAWRKVCLTAHPDKHGDKSAEELEAVNLNFVKLQEAFNVLSDVKKRRKYDSMGEFDERVPSKLKEGQDFYEVFGEVFRRNAKWSEIKPVPDLGDADTPYEKVKAFYDFWFEFESWRDLDEMIMEECGEDCFQDLEEAECREEKRWMERENAKLRAKYQKVERQRIFGLTETAEKFDPRVRAEKEKQFAAREAEKAAKQAQKVEAERQAKEDAARKAAEEEKLREEQKLEKARLEKEKQAKKTARAKLRKLVQNLELGIFEDQLQEFLLVLDVEETSSLTKALEVGGSGEAVFTSMKSKGFEAIIVPRKTNEDEKSTEAGSGDSTEETVDPEEAKRIAKEQEERRKQQEKRKKKEDEVAAKLRAEEEAKRAAEKEAREIKKKAEQEKREREQQKANKKEIERLKREEEKKIKDEEKAAEKARLEKEANKKLSEEQRKKNLAAKEAEDAAKLLEARTVELERDRLARADVFEKLEWNDIVEAAKAALEDPMVAAGLASASTYADAEDLLDGQLSCLGSYFALGVRPDANAPQMSSGLRNRVKKIRTRIRAAVASGELPVTATVEASADDAILEQFEAAARGECQPPNAKVEAAPEVAPEDASPQKAKKKTKAKAAPADEDLDSLLEEFGMTPTETKAKKGGKKK